MYNKSVRKDGKRGIIIRAVFKILKIKTQGYFPVIRELVEYLETVSELIKNNWKGRNSPSSY